MERIILTRAGLGASQLGLGLSRTHYRSEQENIALIKHALQLGISHFDTARLYGHGRSENILGAAISGMRDRVTIATKFGIWPSSLIEHAGPARRLIIGGRAILSRAGAPIRFSKNYAKQALASSVKRSLRALKTDYLDVLFIHDPDEIEAQAVCADDELFVALEQLKRAGVVRTIGIAGSAAAVETLTRARPGAFDIVQMSSNDAATCAVVPDVTFGHYDRSDATLSAATRFTSYVSSIRDALARRPSTCVLVSTTNSDHLTELVSGVGGVTPE